MVQLRLFFSEISALFTSLFLRPDWRNVLDIAITSFIIYQLIRLVVRTRASSVFKGIGLVLVFAWLAENAWRYGFILRYPLDTTEITGIIYEPWHYRYVGVEMALEIRDLGGITLEEYIDNLTNDGTTCGGQKAE